MAGQSIVLILALLAQDKPKDEAKEKESDRAKRAAIIDEAMKPAPAARVAPAPAAVVDAIEAVKTTVEVKTVEEPAPQAPGPAARVMAKTAVVRRSQRRVTLEPKQAPKPAPVDDEENPAPAPVMFNNLTDMAIARETYEQWIFTSQLNDESRRVRLETMLEQQVTQAMTMHNLNGPQQAKLRLAGSGDIKRFFDRVDAGRAEFEAVRQDYNAGMRVLNALEPLPTEYQVGPFGPDSFFMKTLDRMGFTPKDDKPAH